LLFVEGRTEEALDLSERLPRVAPFDIYWRGQHVGHFHQARQYENALEEAERVRVLEPEFLVSHEIWCYAGLGRFDEAHRTQIAIEKRCGEPCDRTREALERGWAEGDWEGSLRAWLDVLAKIEGHSPWNIASLYGRIGETDETLAWLERGYRARDPFMTLTKADPAFDPLRSDPRFDDLLRRIGFPEE
jgi:hypothetical protein